MKSAKGDRFISRYASMGKKKYFHSMGCKPIAWEIPAEAGIHDFQAFLDPGFRRGDGLGEFCMRLPNLRAS
jgi:hypothetical protein